MAARSIFQHEYARFQAEHEFPGEKPANRLLLQRAHAAYQQALDPVQMTLDELESFTELEQATLQTLNSIETTKEPIPPERLLTGLSETERAALCVFAAYDRGLYLLIKERQPIEKTRIKATYRSILKQYHPDQNPKTNANQVICTIRQAYGHLRPLLDG